MFLTALAPAPRTDTMRARLDDAEAALRQALEGLSSVELTSEDAVAVVEAAARIERCAAGVVLLAAPALPDDDHFKTTGHHSTARWLARVRGASVADARHTLAAGAALDHHPHTRAAVASGLLSRHQTPEITDALDADPATEADLLHAAAVESLHHLRSACDRIKASARGDDEVRHRRARTRRGLTFGTTRDGSGTELRGNGPADQGAVVFAALRQHHQHAFDRAHERGERPSYPALMWDALVDMARAALGHEPTDSHRDPDPDRGGSDHLDPDDDCARGDSGDDCDAFDECDECDEPAADHREDTAGEPAAHAHPAEPTGPAPRRRRTGAAVDVIVRIDYTALVRGHTVSGETCDIAGVGPVPVTAVREILASGDPFLSGVITHGRKIAGVVRYGRSPDTFQHVALRWLHPICAAEGCDNTILEWDHNREFNAEQRTVLENLDGLCGPTHKLKTHHGWRLVNGTGRRPFVPPGHPDHPGDPTRHPRRTRDPDTSPSPGERRAPDH